VFRPGRSRRPMDDIEKEQAERFDEAIRLFDAEEFFACHDVLEELWSETYSESRDFLQGLIHAAVALFHFGEGNLSGARKMYESHVRYLKPYLPSYAGLDLTGFERAMEDCFAELIHAGREYPHGARLPSDRIPRLSGFRQPPLPDSSGPPLL